MRLNELYPGFSLVLLEDEEWSQLSDLSNETQMHATEEFQRQMDLKEATWGLRHWQEAYGLAADLSLVLERERLSQEIGSGGSRFIGMLKKVASGICTNLPQEPGFTLETQFTPVFHAIENRVPTLEDAQEFLQAMVPKRGAGCFIVLYRSEFKLLKLLPDLYLTSYETADFENAVDVHLDEVKRARDEFMLQLDLNTATWGLDAWEEAYGITREAGKDVEFRRSRLKSKMRGQGTTTVAMFKNMVESFVNGLVEVVDIPAEFRFEVKFVSTIGHPPNLDDVAAAIEELKPAHLRYSFVFLYRTYGELGRFTHAQLAAYTHQQLRAGEMNAPTPKNLTGCTGGKTIRS